MKSLREMGMMTVSAALVILVGGCATQGQGGLFTGGIIGALGGGGIGALAGQAVGHNTEATLIGTAVGAGIGYIVGNEADKRKAQKMSQETQASNYSHNEVGPLANTKWQVVSLAPQETPAYTSKIIEFGPDGHVVTTTTYPDGRVEIANEEYRVVGSTLIINKPGYIINAKYSISNNQLIMDADNFRAVMNRLS
jgi:hypothetical protein